MSAKPGLFDGLRAQWDLRRLNLSLSEQEQIDLVVMSAHGYSGEAERPYGGLTGRFITEGKLPLLIVQDQPQELSRMTEDVMSNGHPGR